MKGWFLAIFMSSSTTLLATSGLGEDLDSLPLPSDLAGLAARADVVAVIQVLDTDYEYTRDFPSGGTAFLKILIPYKVTRPLKGILEVYEEGLHAHECYFPNPSVLEEGRRFLVFLRQSDDVEGQYNGMEQGCALEIFVTTDNRYALGAPLLGLHLTRDYLEHAVPLVFSDAHALMSYEELAPEQRTAWLDAGWLVETDSQYRLTHGIELGVTRKLLEIDPLAARGR